MLQIQIIIQSIPIGRKGRGYGNITTGQYSDNFIRYIGAIQIILYGKTGGITGGSARKRVILCWRCLTDTAVTISKIPFPAGGIIAAHICKMQRISGA